MRLIKHIHKTKTSKAGSFRLMVDMDIPPLDGFMDTSVVSKVLAQEMVDHVALFWSTGRDLSGSHRSITKRGLRIRSRNNAVHHREPLDPDDEFSRILAYNQNSYEPARRFARKSKANYRTRSALGGKKIRPSRNYLRAPEFEQMIPFYISGKMINSLYGRYKKGRTYFNKRLGKRIEVASSITLGVHKSRVKTAFGQAGFNKDFQRSVVSSWNSGVINQRYFPRSRAIRRNLLNWGNLRGGMNIAYRATVIMLRGLAFLSRRFI